MMSIPSMANVTNAEFIRDVALCIRSFHGSNHLVPLSKFCERFEEIIGYSIKEHLEECRYSFPAVIRQVLRRTRTRCEYDANQEMIILDPEKYNSTMNYNETVLCYDGDRSSTTSSCYASPCESSLLNEEQMLNTSTDYLSVIDGNTSFYCDASEGSSFYHSFDSEDLPEEEEDINEERYTDWNAHCVHEVPPSVAEAHDSLHSSAPSLEEEEISTEHRRYEEMVYGGKIMVEPSPYLLNEDLERNRLESLTLTTLYDSNQSEENHARRSSSSSSSSSSSEEEDIIKERYTDWNAHCVHEVSPSVTEAQESLQSSSPFLEEEEISTESRGYEQMVDGGNVMVEPSPYLQIECHSIKRQVNEDLARNRLESLKLTTLCDSNQSEENHARRSSSSSSEEEDDIEESYTDWNAHDVREVSPSVAEAHESQESSAPSSQEEEISIEHMRIKMKNACISLWGDKVRHLPEILCILKMCHHIYGPLSITSCEEVIESCFNPDGERNNWSLIKDGGRMDVKRMFELKMFQLSKPPNRMEVQPVDCILKSKFRMLPKGLISEVYKALLKSKKGKTVKEIMEMMTPFLKANDDFSRLNEIKEAILTVPDVIRINNDYLELSNDDAFFVITDQII